MHAAGVPSWERSPVMVEWGFLLEANPGMDGWAKVARMRKGMMRCWSATLSWPQRHAMAHGPLQQNTQAQRDRRCMETWRMRK